jgi:hypothetical protein
MRSFIVFAVALGAVAVFAPVTPVSAGDGAYANGHGHHGSRRQRKAGPRVKGYTHYWYGDACYDLPDPDERYLCQFAGFIDPELDKQTPAGPFDSGFFFNSGIGQNGGESPYMN